MGGRSNIWLIHVNIFEKVITCLRDWRISVLLMISCEILIVINYL